ncbi:hypothetical protein AB0J27_20185 [Micromonospora chokoriensis]
MSRSLRIDSTETVFESEAALDVQASLHIDGGAFLRLSKTGRSVSAHFSADDARRIGEWLMNRYGLAPYAAKVGEVVQILPDAERYDGDEVDYPDVRRAKVVFGLDSDGEYRVEIIDGDDAGETFYVAAEFIRHADAIMPEVTKPAEAKTETPAVAPALVEGQEYRLLPGSKFSDGTTSTLAGEGVTRVKAENADGRDIWVTAVDGRRPGAHRLVDPKYLAPLTAEAAASDIEVGREYRLLPGSTYTNGVRSYFRDDVTRVRVTKTGPGLQGNVRAQAVDGARPGQEWHTDPKYLAPLTAEAPAALKVGDVVALKPGAKTTYRGGVYFNADVTRVKVEATPDGNGDYLVRNVNGSGTEHGTGTSDTQYVGRAYLGDPEPTAERPWAVGDEAIVTAVPGTAFKFGMFRFNEGERIRLTADAGERTERAGLRAFRARSVDGRETSMVYASALKRPEATAEEFKPVVGGVYALKADARNSVNRRLWLLDEGTTKVKVTRAEDSDGDFTVTAVDGRRVGALAYVYRSGLAPLAEATPAKWAPGDEAVVVSEWGSFRMGDRVDVTRPQFTQSDGDTFVPVRRQSDGLTGTCYAYRIARPLTGALAPRPLAVGDIAIVTADNANGARVYTGDRVEITQVKPSGGFRGIVLDSYSRSGRTIGADGWHFRASDLRRP